jgi:molybdenum cofactor biosynthesis enzyme MoaA
MSGVGWGAPRVPLGGLDELWFQVAGTVCNLSCGHCFISCSPMNHTFEFLGLDHVQQALEESKALGVREFYFTGGEPFIHPQIAEILEAALEVGPATVLSNATVLRPEVIERLARAEERSPYSLEFRVSLDGYSAEMNDPLRGPGTFVRILAGVRLLLAHGFLPIISVVKTWEDGKDEETFRRFETLLGEQGYSRPRLKIIPTLRIGAEQTGHRGYLPYERVTPEMMWGYDSSQLLCSHSRTVTSRGIYVCPILLDSAEARLGETLAESLRPYPIQHGACFTCYLSGAVCANLTAGVANAT